MIQHEQIRVKASVNQTVEEVKYQQLVSVHVSGASITHNWSIAIENAHIKIQLPTHSKYTSSNISLSALVIVRSKSVTYKSPGPCKSHTDTFRSTPTYILKHLSWKLLRTRVHIVVTQILSKTVIDTNINIVTHTNTGMRDCIRMLKRVELLTTCTCF